MKFKKLVLILGILAVVSVFTISTGFAASSEKITGFNSNQSITYDYKIIKISHVFKSPSDGKDSEYFRINVKKAYQNKYKIKSVKAKISVYDDYEITKTYYKTYNIKNKNKAYIKLPNSNGTNWYNIEKITVFYKTKSKIKNESTKFQKYATFKSTTKFNGINSNIVLKEKGYYKWTAMGEQPYTTYQHFQIKTKNKKYKIKSVKVSYYNRAGFDSSKNLKGYGKSKLSFKFYDTNYEIFVGAFVIKYY